MLVSDVAGCLYFVGIASGNGNYVSEPGLTKEDLIVALAEQKNFLWASMAVFGLYWFFYFPGLIFNILWINEASLVQRVIGRQPRGKTCLTWMLVAGIIPLIFTLITFANIIGQYSHQQELRRSQQVNQDIMRHMGPSMNGMTITTERVRKAAPPPSENTNRVVQ